METKSKKGTGVVGNERNSRCSVFGCYYVVLVGNLDLVCQRQKPDYNIWIHRLKYKI